MDTRVGFLFVGAFCLVSFSAYAKDPKCAKMKSWAKIEGYSYQSTQKSLPTSSEEDHSENEATLIICNKSGDVVWTQTDTSEYIEYSLEADDLNNDKTKELIVYVAMGAAYPYANKTILRWDGTTFEPLGSFLESMYDGELVLEDLDGDGIREAIYQRIWLMDLPNSEAHYLPDVYVFNKSGTLDSASWESYPKLIESTLEELYSECGKNGNTSACLATETALQLAKTSGSLDLTPALPALSKTISHSIFSGWSADSAELGYCAPSDTNPAATRCAFLSSDGKTTRSLTDDAAGTLLPDKTKEIAGEKAKTRTNNLTVLKDYPDLSLVWRVDTSKKFVVLKLGAQRVGNQAAYLLSVTLDLKKEGLSAKTLEAHPEMISLSPDGTKVGVILHASDGAKHVYRAEVIALKKLVSHTYNVAGLEFHRESIYGLSAPLFAKAHAVDADAKWPAYNLACAYARLEDKHSAKKALETVLAQKNKEVLRKIATDPDLDYLRKEPWFPAP